MATYEISKSAYGSNTYEFKDKKSRDELVELVDSGAKNLLTINSGSGTANFDIPATITPGKYVVYFGSITSTDTDYTTCQVIALHNSTVVSASPQLQMSRGTAVHGTITVNSAANKIQIYASRTGTAASGDTLTFSNAMLCTEAAWAISQAYVPYCPTPAEMWAAIQALQT